MDEIKRSDGSVEAQQFGELLKRVRYGKFDQYAYVGNSHAVYLDEIKSSDGSVEAQQCGELLKRVRWFSGSTTMWRIIKTCTLL